MKNTQFISRVLFSLFYLVVSSWGATLGFLPAILFGLIGLLITGELEYLPTFLLEIIEIFPVIFLPFAFFIVPFIISAKVKKITHFFFITLLVLVASYVSTSFRHIGSHLEGDILFILTAILYILFVCYSLTIVWSGIFLSKQYKKSYLLLLPLFLDFLLLLSPNLIFNVYIFIGELFNKYYTFNFFWLDYGGFGIIFLNLINCIFALILMKVKFSEIGNHEK